MNQLLSQPTIYQVNHPQRSVAVSRFSEPREFRADPVLAGFYRLGYHVLRQSDIISGRHQAILRSYRNGILGDRFRLAMQRINYLKNYSSSITFVALITA